MWAYGRSLPVPAGQNSQGRSNVPQTVKHLVGFEQGHGWCCAWESSRAGCGRMMWRAGTTTALRTSTRWRQNTSYSSVWGRDHVDHLEDFTNKLYFYGKWSASTHFPLNVIILATMVTFSTKTSIFLKNCFDRNGPFLGFGGPYAKLLCI